MSTAESTTIETTTSSFDSTEPSSIREYIRYSYPTPTIKQVTDEEVDKVHAEISYFIEGQEDVPNPTCLVCDVRFLNMAELKIHTMKHTELNICFVCKLHVKERVFFEIHIQNHMRNKPFLCLKCDKTYSSIGKVQKHYFDVHEVFKPFVCPECDKHFRTWKKLGKHMKAHAHLIRYGGTQ